MLEWMHVARVSLHFGILPNEGRSWALVRWIVSAPILLLGCEPPAAVDHGPGAEAHAPSASPSNDPAVASAEDDLSNPACDDPIDVYAGGARIA